MFPRNPIILLIDVYSLLRREVVDVLAAGDSADDDSEDGGGGGDGGVGYKQINRNRNKINLNIL